MFNNFYGNLTFTFFCLSVICSLSCGVRAQSEWAKLEYYFNVGSLPPPYHYSYTITINSEGKGELVYISGYQEKDKTYIGHPFELDNNKLESLKNAVKESVVLDLDIKTRPNEQIPDGGHSDCLKIFGLNSSNPADELVVLKTIPSYPELKYESTLNKLYKVIQNSVPDDLWNEVKSPKEK